MAPSSFEILFVSYLFPPIGGGGVQRSLKFARYLSHYGVRPIVVCGPERGGARWDPSDSSLAAQLPKDLPVFRPHKAPPPAGRFARAISRRLGRPSALDRWIAESLLAAGLEAAKRHQPQAVYVTLGPYAAHAAAAELSRVLSLPLVADLRDPWALDEVQSFPTSWHRKRELESMRRFVSVADLVIMNTPTALEAARGEFAELDADRFGCLTNGYDDEDFGDRTPRTPDRKFRIVHTGSFYTTEAHQQRRLMGRLKRVLGGERADVDFFARSHVYLMRALELLDATRPDLAENIELHLIGGLNESDRRVITASPFADRVKTPGHLNHDQTIRALVEADLLFLPLHKLAGGERPSVVPGKTYEYLASGRPILGALPASDARDFLLEAEAGRAVEPDDAQAMSEAIEAFMDEAPAPGRSLGASVKRFERRSLTERLARHIREVVGAPDP